MVSDEWQHRTVSLSSELPGPSGCVLGTASLSHRSPLSMPPQLHFYFKNSSSPWELVWVHLVELGITPSAPSVDAALVSVCKALWKYNALCKWLKIIKGSQIPNQPQRENCALCHQPHLEFQEQLGLRVSPHREHFRQTFTSNLPALGPCLN